jgi:hypothetical protein
MLKHGAFCEVDILMAYIPVLPAPLRGARQGKSGALRGAESTLSPFSSLFFDNYYEIG